MALNFWKWWYWSFSFFFFCDHKDKQVITVWVELFCLPEIPVYCSDWIEYVFFSIRLSLSTKSLSQEYELMKMQIQYRRS